MMRTLFEKLFFRHGFAVALILLTLACREGAWAQFSAPVDVVVDLDGTLIFNETGAGPDAFEVEGKWYRLGGYSRQFLEGLRRVPGVRISFFSGGGRDRNEKVLKHVKFSDGRSAFDIAYRDLSADDMVQVSLDAKMRYSARYKKDLSKVNPDLRRVVMVDDIRNFLLPGQESNMIWIGEGENKDRSLRSALNLIRSAESLSRSDPDAFLGVIRAGFCSRIFSD